MLKKSIVHFLGFISVLLLFGCVAPGARDATNADASALYNAMVGQMAAQRKQTKLASRSLTKAALASGDVPTVQSLFEQILKDGLPSDAMLVAKHWAALEPNLARPWWHVATLALDINDYAQSSMAFLRWLGGEPSQGPEAVNALTYYLASHDEPQAAFSVLQLLLKAEPAQLMFEVGLAETALFLHAPEQALSASTRASDMLASYAAPEEFPKSLNNDLRRIKWQARLQMLDKSVLDDMRVIADQNDDLSLKHTYVLGLVQAYDYSEAQLELELILKEPRDASELAQTANFLGLLALERGRLDDAMHIAEQLVARGQNDALMRSNALFLRGQVHERQDEYKFAIRDYINVTHGASVRDAQAAAARLIASQENLEGGFGLLMRLAEQDRAYRLNYILSAVDLALERSRPDLVAVAFDAYRDALSSRRLFQMSEAFAYTDLEKHKKADALYKALIKRWPNDPEVANAYGYALADRGKRLNEAKQSIEKAFAMRPHNPAILDSMGWVHYRLNDIEKAEGFLEQAYARDRDADIAAHLGEVLWVQNKRVRAQRVWQEAAKRTPDSKLLKQTRKRFGQ